MIEQPPLVEKLSRFSYMKFGKVIYTSDAYLRNFDIVSLAVFLNRDNLFR